LDARLAEFQARTAHYLSHASSTAAVANLQAALHKGTEVAALRIAGFIVAAGVAGCAGGPKPAIVNAVIEASPTVNPSVSSRPSPLVIRVYELKSPTAFNSADFMSLYQRDQAELGADLVSKEEIVLQPGEKRPMTKTLAVGVRFVGVLAAYRDVDRAQWRSVVPVQPGKQRLLIRADERAVAASVVK
jgi:type VI secretion system protein VasD